MTKRPSVRRRLPVPGQSPGDERLLAMVAALTAELAVTRERLDTVERLAEAAGLFGPAEVERFAADAEQGAARDAIRQTIIAHVFAPLKADTEQQP
ncbi:hypothetical protein ACFFDA_05465 [Novosphingobium sp. BL-52-GroH]